MDETPRLPTLTRRASLLLPLALGGCSWFDWLTDEQKKPIPGDREPVLAAQRGLTVSASGFVTLPPLTTNADWTEFGGGPTHVGGNLAGGLSKLWSTGIGTGGSYRARLTAQPLVIGSRIFTMDTDAAIAAIDLKTGHHIWHMATRPKHNSTANLGGGIALGNGCVYVATGRGEMLALDQGDGHIIWRTPLTAPARGSPTLVGQQIFTCTIDNTLVSVSTDRGIPLWSYQAAFSDTGVLSQSAPAFADGLVVAGFESGDLSAVRADTGTLVWSDNLGALQGQTGLKEFDTIRGAPVIDNGLVHAIGLGGLMAALDLRSGRRVWQRDVAGSNTPWVAGDVMYIVSADQKLAALSKADGSVFWVTELPRFENPGREKGLINWTGPAMIAGKLIVVSDNEHMIIADPVTGTQISKTSIPDTASVTPIACQNTVLLLTDDATLTAYH